jgi:hypothetical protein
MKNTIRNIGAALTTMTPVETRYDDETHSLTLEFSQVFTTGSEYEVRVGADVKDKAGNKMGTDHFLIPFETVGVHSFLPGTYYIKTRWWTDGVEYDLNIEVLD